MNSKRKAALESEVEYTIGEGWYRTYAEAAEMVISRGQTTTEESEYLRQETARWDRNDAALMENWGKK